MSEVSIGGILAPVPTPFDAAGEVAADRLAANIAAICAAGADGVVLLGSNGEAALLDEAERRTVIRAGLAAVPAGKLGLVGTGAESTRAALRMTEFAAEQGARAVMVVHPSYYKPQMTAAALREFYTAVADASPAPVLLYSVPKFTGFDIPPELVVELSGHPNIIGIKDSSGNVVQLQGFVDRCRPGWSVLVGSASALYPALAVGCSGGVLALADLAPAGCADLYRRHRAGDLAGARQLQAVLGPVNNLVANICGVPGVKYAMDRRGLYGGPPRPPLRPLGEPDRRAVDTLLETLTPNM